MGDLLKGHTVVVTGDNSQNAPDHPASDNECEDARSSTDADATQQFDRTMTAARADVYKQMDDARRAFHLGAFGDELENLEFSLGQGIQWIFAQFIVRGI